ncbi:Aminopeptidase 2 mitochondrial, partial [Cladochytrium tenue]
MCFHHHAPEADTDAAAAAAAAAPAREVLPTCVVPAHYTVSITPNLESFVFSGIIDIEVAVKETTKVITVNSNELEIQKASVVVRLAKTETAQEAAAVTFDKALERVSFEFGHEIPAGASATLHVEFTGVHNDKLAGFYRSAYTDGDGNKKHIVVTQFEPTDCRRAFPSFDEPALKATFDVTLVVEPHLVALSNMQVTKTEPVEVDGKKLKAVTFARTPVMSTYLVAFAVGEFEYIEKTAYPKSPAGAAPITCRVYAFKEDVQQGTFALDVCVKTLEFFSEYFNMAYPLPKCDLIAIPDFGAGAMENWGSYSKGASVIRMLNTFLGGNKFMNGVREYLKEFQYRNTVTSDLWKHLKISSGVEVGSMMHEWTREMGYPLVSVSGEEYDS